MTKKKTTPPAQGIPRRSALFKHHQLRKLASYPLAGTTAESVLLEIKPKESHR